MNDDIVRCHFKPDHWYDGYIKLWNDVLLLWASLINSYLFVPNPSCWNLVCWFHRCSWDCTCGNQSHLAYKLHYSKYLKFHPDSLQGLFKWFELRTVWKVLPMKSLSVLHGLAFPSGTFNTWCGRWQGCKSIISFSMYCRMHLTSSMSVGQSLFKSSLTGERMAVKLPRLFLLVLLNSDFCTKVGNSDGGQCHWTIVIKKTHFFIIIK